MTVDSRQEFCALDLETSGISAFVDRIVEIGMVRFTLQGEIQRYSTLVNPGQKLSPEVIAVHGITDAMLVGAPAFSEIARDVIKFIGNRPLVIQNPGFDLSFMKVECWRAGCAMPSALVYDTVETSRHAFPGLSSYKLENICTHIGFSVEYHRALPDAVACARVFSAGVRQAAAQGLLDAACFRGRSSDEYMREYEKCAVSGGVIRRGVACRIRYTDNGGTVSDREIMPLHVFRKGKKTYVYARCGLRGEERCFSAGRIRILREDNSPDLFGF